MAKRLTASFVLLVCFALPAAPQVRARSWVRVPEGVMRGLRITKVDPVYPPPALKAGVQGAVVLRVTVKKSGEIEYVRLVSGDPSLTRAAMDAVKQWKYKPYLLNGRPVDIATTVRLDFIISQGTGGTVTDASEDEKSAEGIVGVIDAPPGTTLGSVPERVRVSAGVERLLLQSMVDPVYPPDAKAQRIQGIVILKVTIDRQGNVHDVEIIGGPMILAAAATDAVKQWKYRPYLLNATPVEVESEVQVNFSLPR